MDLYLVLLFIAGIIGENVVAKMGGYMVTEIGGYVVAKIGGYLVARIGGYVVARTGDYLVTVIGEYLIAPIREYLVVALIREYLIAPIRYEIGYLFCYNKNIEDLRNQIEDLETDRARVQKLVDVAEMNGEDIVANVRVWLASVNLITEECTNFFNEQQLPVDTWCFNSQSCCNLKLRFQRSKEARAKATEVDKLKRDCKFDRVSCPAPPHFDSRKSILKNVMKALKNDQIHMIGIYGVGGVGKTTLVKEIGKKAKDDDLLDEVVMAVVSLSPDIRIIQDEIADMLGLKFNEESVLGRAGWLSTRLKEKRILVILDDIWDKVELDAIGIPFGATHRGCKIVLTSRSLDVCQQMNAQKNFLVEFLSEQESWNLFQKMAGDSVDSPDLHPLAVQVAKECAGLPLAIVTLAEKLRNKSLPYWKDTADQLLESILDKKVFLSLELSYNYLKSEEARLFFLLCCLYPEDHNIAIQDLMRYGMGLGLFQVHTVDEATVRALTLANELKASCLLQDSSFKDCVKMHDVVRDVAISIASKDKHVFLVRAGPEWKKLPGKDTIKQYTAISLKSHDIIKLPDKLKCPQLQILLLECPHPSLKFPNNFFLRMKNLKVLDMSGMQFLSLPSTLRHLKNLRTLCLERCKLKDLSTIGELEKLEILSLLDSDIVELPRQIGRLSHLRLLDLTRCRNLTRIPPDVIRGLSQLEGLYMAGGFVKWEIERQDQKRGNASLAELENLSCLINLEVDIPDDNLWPKDLLLEKLSRFRISIGDFSSRNNYSYSKSLRLKVNISTPLEDGVNMLLKAAEDIQLMEMKGLNNVLNGLDTEGFQRLRCLKVKKCREVEYILKASEHVSCVAFPILEKLELDRLPNLKEICHDQLPSGCFRNLSVVKVENCDGLKNLFSHSISKDLSKLVELEVGLCDIMEQVFGIEDEEVAMDAIVFPHLRSLRLEYLPNLRTFWSKMKGYLDTHTEQPLFDNKVAFPALEGLEINDVGNFKEIWHPQFPALSFSQLKFLRVENCTKMLYVVPFNLLRRLWTLEELSVRGCDSVEEVVEVGRLGIEEGDVIGTLFQLRELKLWYLPKLKHMWWDKYPHGTLGFQNLSSINMFQCNSLKSLFSPSTAGSLVQLQEVIIDSCKMMEMIIAKEREGEENCIDIIVFPQLHSLILKNLPKLMGFYTGRSTLNFPSLKDGFPGMKTFTSSTQRPQKYETNDKALDKSPEKCDLYISIQPLFDKKVVFPTLEVLKIKGMKFKDIWHPQLPAESFCQVRVLEVECCHKLLNVVPSNLLKGLTKLEEISVKKCDSVERIFEIEQLAVKDRHEIGTFSQLKKLELSGLPRLFTSKNPILEKLQINDEDFEEKPEEGNSSVPIKALFDELVTFPTLEELKIKGLDNLKDIWHPQLPAESLCELRVLEVESCHKLSSVVPSNLLKGLTNLEEVSVKKCDSVEMIFEIEQLAVKERHGMGILSQLRKLELSGLPKLFTSKHPFLQKVQINEEEFKENLVEGNTSILIHPLFDEWVTFPTLEELIIKGLDNMKDIWHPQLPAESFCELRVLEVESCQKLLNIVPPNLLKGLMNLEEVSIKKCDSVEMIFEIEQLSVKGRHGIGNLSQLRKLELSGLPKLFNSKHPFLQKLQENDEEFEENPEECNSSFPIQPLFDEWVTFPSLEELKIKDLDNLKDIWQSELPADSFPQLRILEVESCHKLLNVFPSNILKGLKNLEEVYVKECESVEVIFEIEEPFKDRHGTRTLAQLRELKLRKLPKLKYIWLTQDPNESPDLQSLSSLDIYRCYSLRNVFSPSMASGLAQLKEVNIHSCEMMEAIVVKDSEGEANPIEIIVFPQVHTLKLQTLPNLTSFCIGSCTLKWPSLKVLWIVTCPRMKSFTSKSPILQKHLMTDEELEETLKEGNSCIPIRPLFDESVTFPTLEELKIKGLDDLEDIWHPQLPAESFRELRVLKVKSCHKLLKVVPFNSLKELQNLEEVYVRECDSVEIIFELEELAARERHGTRVLPRLRRFLLRALPKLFTSECPILQKLQMNDEEFKEKSEEENPSFPIQSLFNEWVSFTNLEYLWILDIKNLQEIFHSQLPDKSFSQLRFLQVRGCHKLSRVAPSSLLPRLNNLEELVVQECDLMNVIFDLEGLVGEGHMSLLQLEKVELCNLPSLGIFCLGNYNFEFPSLETLILDECPKMQRFSSGSISTPKLNTITVEDDEELWEGDLNRTVDHLFLEKGKLKEKKKKKKKSKKKKKNI